MMPASTPSSAPKCRSTCPVIGAGRYPIWWRVSRSCVFRYAENQGRLMMWHVLAGTALPSSSKRSDMFFPGKITLIRPAYKVLEIGPGASPYPRSDAFLELDFDSSQDKISQRGGGLEEANLGDRPVHYYDGEKFPLENNQFDYVICSHVIEHVADPVRFLKEVFRVGAGEAMSNTH